MSCVDWTKSIIYMSMKLWNALKLEIKEMKSYTKLNLLLKSIYKLEYIILSTRYFANWFL